MVGLGRKVYVWAVVVGLFLVAGCQESGENPRAKSVAGPQRASIRVGVFYGHGGAQSCVWEAYEALRRDGAMRPYYVTSAEVANGVLDTLEAIIIPGGGGSRQWLNLGGQNHRRIVDFVQRGGGVLGICAGAYLLSSTPEYACMGLSRGVAIDIEHDNRGHGVADATLSALGKELFPELVRHDTIRIVYYEGPVYDTMQQRYAVFATMESDVHTEGGAPSNMTNGRPFIIGDEVGRGRVMACIAHPEATPGMQWMIPRMVRWTLRSAIEPYGSEIVNPRLAGRECLMTEEMLQREKAAFKIFLYGTAEDKVAALTWLRSVVSWDAKRWVQGLLYDEAPRVRAAAAEYVAWMGYTRYLPDVKAAAATEQDVQTKAALDRALGSLTKQLAEGHK